MKAPQRAVSEYLSRDGTTLVAPAGMGDLLPPDAAERRELSRRVLRSFELAGYDLVTPPVFEHGEVIHRGHELFDNRELLRFVEPDSGEVAVLRPDITPQIARIIATQLNDRPPPFRLCYEGRVFRAQRGRARIHRQISQVGVECVGIPGSEGDTEILALLIGALESVGLHDFKVELSDANLVRASMEAVPEQLRAAFTDALSLKDTVTLAALGRQYGVPRAKVRALCSLAECFGGADALDRAGADLKGPAVRAALGNLRETNARLAALGMGGRVIFDLGETRGWDYYTGLRFTVLVDGPGEALGQGGRYDRLLSGFGTDSPATGFALALDHLQSTLREHERRNGARRELRLVLSGNGSPKSAETAGRLRAADMVVACLAETDLDRCLAFARAWGYHGVLRQSRLGLQLIAGDGTRHKLDAPDPRQIRKLITP